MRPGLSFSRRQKRELELHKKKEETEAKRPKSYQEQEKMQREIGLNTAISVENKGFQMMSKMGFKPGASLGRIDTGLKEPLKVIVKETTSGVGRDEQLKAAADRRKQLKEAAMRRRERRFRAAMNERNMRLTLQHDFENAQAVCEELDFREQLKAPKKIYYWSRETVKKLLQRELGSSDEDDDDDEEFDNFVNEDNLHEIIDYLRDNYNYCLYCVYYGNSKEDLAAYCPGRTRLEHDCEVTTY